VVCWFTGCVRSPVRFPSYAEKKTIFFFLTVPTSIAIALAISKFFLMPSKNDMLIVGQDNERYIKPMLFQGLSFSRANCYFLAPESWFDRDSFKFRAFDEIDPFSVLTLYNGYPWKITLSSVTYTLNKYYHELEPSTIYCVYLDKYSTTPEFFTECKVGQQCSFNYTTVSNVMADEYGDENEYIKRQTT